MKTPIAKALVLAGISALVLASMPRDVAAFSFGKRGQTDKAKEVVPVIHDKWAVVIGAGDYQDPSLQSLMFSERAAQGVSDALTDKTAGKFQPDHVITLTREKATKSAITAALSDSWLLSKALPNDLIVVYFCSRAVPTRDGKALILCTYDTASQSFESSGLILHDLLTELRKRSQCKNIVCFLDLQPLSSTVSSPTNLLFPVGGGAGAAVPAVSNAHMISPLARLSQVSNVSLVSGNALLAPSFESMAKRNTYFAYYLSEGIRQNGGLQPLGVLTQYVGENILNDARGELHQEQLLETRLVPESAYLGSLALGVPIIRAQPMGASVRIGYDYDRLGIERPDLMPGAPPSMHSYPSVRGQLTSNSQGAVPSLDRQVIAQANQAAGGSQNPVEKRRPADDDDDEDDSKPQVDLNPYIQHIKAHIQSKWQPPKGLEQKKLVVIFTILRDGTITDPEITQPSGEATVDESALAALKAASPLPPLPTGAPKSIRISYKFQWSVSHSAVR